VLSEVEKLREDMKTMVINSNLRNLEQRIELAEDLKAKCKKS
jgi:hypothetical protein